MLAYLLLWIDLFQFRPSDYGIVKMTTEDGLLSNAVYTVTRDDSGRYWIASTGGLQMYDGYTFRSYSSQQGLKIKDLLHAKYNNGYLYTYSLSQMEIIPIKTIERNSQGIVYDFDILKNSGEHQIDDTLIRFYTNYYEIFKGHRRLKKVQLAYPYFDIDSHKISSLIYLNQIVAKDWPFLNRSNVIKLNPLSNLYTVYLPKLASKHLATINNGKLNLHCRFNFLGHALVFIDDSTYWDFDAISRETMLFRNCKHRLFSKGPRIHQIVKFDANSFFVTSSAGLDYYRKLKYHESKLDDFNFDRIRNHIFDPKDKNLQGQFFKLNSYVCIYNVEDKKIINKNLGNIKSYYAFNDSLMLLGFRAGDTTRLINCKTGDLLKILDTVWVKRVKSDRYNNFYLLTYDDFRVIKNGVKRKFKLKYRGSYLLVNDILRVEDKIFFGTSDQGVFVADTLFRIYRHFTTKHGLQSNQIEKLKNSIKGDIWVQSEKGIDKILSNGRIQHIADFKELQFFEVKDFTASEDSLWLFGIDKVYSYNYSTRSKESIIPIVLHEVNIDDSIKYFMHDKDINIQPGWGKIRLDFAGIHLEDQRNIRYRYRIVHDGKATAWYTTEIPSYTSSSFNPGDYDFQVQAYHAIYPNTKSDILHIRFCIKPYFHQTWWFYLLAILGAMSVFTAILMYRNQLKLKAIKMESELHKTTLHGLQNQMNPHFVFNAMNTLQHFILEKDLEKSLRYLNEFSQLIRTILDNSSRFEIFLSEEISFIKKYIQVESKRYDDSFTYEIKIDLPEEDLDDIKIPPMIIQPLVENAIKHGISSLSPGRGKIVLEFREKEEHLLEVIIKDNGQNNLNINSKGSHAIEILQKRLALLNKKSGQASFQLYQKDGWTISHLIIPT